MRLLNLPNTITIIRIVFIPVFVLFLIYRYYDYALYTFIVAGLSDTVDGYLARKMNLQSELGKLLDPLADKLLITTSFVIFTVMGLIPVWFTITIFSRDLFIVMGWFLMFLIFNIRTVRPTLSGKTACALQMLLIGVTLLEKTVAVHGGVQNSLIWATAAFTVISGVQYIYNGLSYRHG